MPTERTTDELLRSTLAAMAPGTALRDGLERILRGRTGALIVLGATRAVEAICTGGFIIDADFSATRLRELAKMDGAIICERDATRIVRAAVQLVPDPAIETSESGTRHRTAERVAKQTGLPVISVSQSMQIIQLYAGDRRHVLEGSEVILARANQAVATLERYKSRLDEVTGSLTALEIEDLATVGDICTVLQRLEMVRRIVDEISTYIIELGTDGRLLTLQLEELVGNLGPAQELLVRDYHTAMKSPRAVADILADVARLSSTELVDITQVARILGAPVGGDALDSTVSPKGYRLLARIQRVPGAIADRLVEHFNGLQPLLAANVDDLMDVDGVGEQRARTVREALSRLAEVSLVDRYS